MGLCNKSGFESPTRAKISKVSPFLEKESALLNKKTNAINVGLSVLGFAAFDVSYLTAR